MMVRVVRMMTTSGHTTWLGFGFGLAQLAMMD
jgi:hypothetical protein